MTEDTKRRNPNQRSYHLDDETVGLIHERAEALKVSDSAALRIMVREASSTFIHSQGLLQYAKPSPSVEEALALADQAGQQARVTTGVETAPANARGIVLPPDNVEEFKVPERFKERGPTGAMPRPVHDDDEDM